MLFCWVGNENKYLSVITLKKKKNPETDFLLICHTLCHGVMVILLLIKCPRGALYKGLSLSLRKTKYQCSSSSTPCPCFLAPHTEWEHLGRCGNICTGVFTARQSVFGWMHLFHQHFLLQWGESFLDNTALSDPEESWSSGEINNAKWSLRESNALLLPTPPPLPPQP